MFNVAESGNMYLTRGDSAYFDVNISDESGEPYVLSETDKLVFTVKKNTREKVPVISKTATAGGVLIFFPKTLLI